MIKVSAGLLMYRLRDGELEVLLAHPGGPFWARKDAGVWTIPKGEVKPGEDLLAAAQREFQEETGALSQPPFFDLNSIQQRSGKVVHAWAFEGDFDPATLRSGTYRMEWPPGTGQFADFPEVDRAQFFAVTEAREKMLVAQVPFLARLTEALQREPLPTTRATK
ncbi:MAG TPA: NUDIX domain-containing protein [Verrucomicrobiae bacterium]|jgi:predicted NUDIX family NTP pyrophosphohydrolase